MFMAVTLLFCDATEFSVQYLLGPYVIAHRNSEPLLYPSRQTRIGSHIAEPDISKFDELAGGSH